MGDDGESNIGTACVACCCLLMCLSLGVCGLTFGILCLDDIDRPTKSACDGVVSQGAAITLIVFGSLATLVLCCCCCAVCFMNDDDSQQESTTTREDNPPDYSSTTYLSRAGAQNYFVYTVRTFRISTIGYLNRINNN